MGWVWILWSYIVIINVIAFITMGLDKSKSRRGRWRIPEARLIGMAIIGGSLGIVVGVYAFRHKTRHAKFKWGIPVIIVVQVILSLWIWRY